MIRAGAAPAGIVLRGIDPDTARSVLDLGAPCARAVWTIWSTPSGSRRPVCPRGRRAAAGDDEPPPHGGKRAPAVAVAAGEVLPSILLGEELFARTLRVFRGSHVDVVCPCARWVLGPMPGLKVFRAAGTSTAGCTSMTPSWLHGAGRAQKFLGGPVSHGIDCARVAPRPLLRSRPRCRPPWANRYEVRSWEDSQPGAVHGPALEKIAMSW